MVLSLLYSLTFVLIGLNSPDLKHLVVPAFLIFCILILILIWYHITRNQNCGM